MTERASHMRVKQLRTQVRYFSTMAAVETSIGESPPSAHAQLTLPCTRRLAGMANGSPFPRVVRLPVLVTQTRASSSTFTTSLRLHSRVSRSHRAKPIAWTEELNLAKSSHLL